MRLWFPESVLLSVICCVRPQQKALDYRLECAQQKASVLWERCVCVCVVGSNMFYGKGSMEREVCRGVQCGEEREEVCCGNPVVGETP